MYDEHLNSHIGDSFLLLLLPPQSLKITQKPQIMHGCEIFIQDGTYQDFLNKRHKRCVFFSNEHFKFIILSNTRANAENIDVMYCNTDLPNVDHIHPHAKMSHLPSYVFSLMKTSNYFTGRLF